MPDLAANIVEPIGGFEMEGMMMRYSLFVPRLYNWCKSLGFEPGKIMPSRAFCSDESQGYPVILLAKHFGAFPFNHGRVGGIVAIDRHGPHAAHGQDMVMVQASHVGYDPESKQFGTYRRLQTTDEGCSSNCGKVFHTIEWYEAEYQFAKKNIRLVMHEGNCCVSIDNYLLRNDVDDGLLLRLDKLIESDENGQAVPCKMLSTAKVYPAATNLVHSLGKEAFNDSEEREIGADLSHDMFFYRRNLSQNDDADHLLEYNLIRYMPQIVTHSAPTLVAAQINTQIEFDRTIRSIIKENSYHGKRVLFVSGLNIDISPKPGQLFPLTKFVPWAAYVQEKDGSYKLFEQEELSEVLSGQSTDNPDQIDLEEAIQVMAKVEEVKVEL